MDVVRYLNKVGPIDPAAMTVREAKAAWHEHRTAEGWSSSVAPGVMTNWDDNVKFAKTRAVTIGLSLAPDKGSGHQVCRFSTPACRRGCVAFAGNGGFASVVRARQTKTRFLLANPQAFVTLVDHEIGLAVKRAAGRRIICRLNTFSDLTWETIAPDLFTRHAGVAFYDYTKWPEDMRQNLPANYVLTQSASERTDPGEIVGSERNWAVVFSASRANALPATYAGRRVIDGDKHDDRSADPVGVVVGLRAKSKMRTQGTKMVKAS